MKTQAKSVSEGDRHSRSLFCGWLPAVDAGPSTLWLPIASRSVSAITDAIICESNAARSIADAIARDPSLAIAATIRWLNDPERSSEPTAIDAGILRIAGVPQITVAAAKPEASVDGTVIKISQLAKHWTARAKSTWRSTDWLACPSGLEASNRWNRFTELDRYFRTLPISRWIEQSGVWLEAGGVDAGSASVLTKLHLVDDRKKSPVTDLANSSNAHEVIGRLIDQIDEATIRKDSMHAEIHLAKRELAHTLAYGLSHEINNPLANIATRAQSLARNEEDTNQRESLQRIVDQTYRAHAMIADLMFYANPPLPNLQTFHVVERAELAIESVAELAMRRSITIRCIYDDSSTFEANGDPEMIGDVIVALVENSIDAIGIDGTIDVHLDSIANEQKSPTFQIRVCDSGPGITAEQAGKAFDPYFSGREAGRGLGLGLCRVQRIMELHNGDIELQPALAGCVATLRWR